MKTILYPTDFSESANNALLIAIDISVKLSAKLEVLHVHTPQVIVGAMPSEMSILETQVSDKILDKIKHLKEKLSTIPKLKFEIIIEKGYLNDLLVQKGDLVQDLLIVMGTEGAPTPLHKWFGTNTSRIIDSKKVPVLTVPKDCEQTLTPNGEVVLASDFKEINDWDIYLPFKQLATAYNLKINVLLVKEPYQDEDIKKAQKAYFEDLKSYFDGITLELHHSYKENVVSAITDFARRKKAKLIVSVSHDRNWLESLFHSSVSKELAFNQYVPILTLPDTHVDLNITSPTNYW
jgi:nucleotide-binding universal stress UspA family protein